MTLETFFEKFDLFAGAPDAVAKMRELVLELAVRGQLSERQAADQNDAPWRVFLEDFDNRVYASDPGPPPPFEIPDEWRWVCVDEVAEACGQKKPDEPFTYIDVASIDNERGLIKPSLEVLSPEDAPSRARKLVRPGTVIYATVRPYLKNIAVIDREFTPPAIISTAFAILHPKAFVDARYLFRWLQSKSFEAEVAERMKGVAYPAINDSEFRGCPIPLPPLAEQKRIVAKVDELMALCDRLEAQQQEREQKHTALALASLARFADAPTPANLDFLFHSSFSIQPSDLRKSILTLAVQGKLVPQDPNDEPAEELIANINKERLAAVKARRISPMKTLPAVEESEVTYDVRPGWALARLVELVMEIQTGPFGSSLHQSDYQTGGTPVINPASLKEGRIVPIESMTIGADTLKRLEVFRLKEGDIVMARRGEMGRCAIVTKVEDGWLSGTGSLVLRMPVGMYAPFLALLIGAPEAREYLCGASVGTTMQNLNQSILAKMPVGVPPLAEQRRIVAKVDELMALVDALEAQLAASRATGGKLLAALVAELTNGTEPHGAA